MFAIGSNMASDAVAKKERESEDAAAYSWIIVRAMAMTKDPVIAILT